MENRSSNLKYIPFFYSSIFENNVVSWMNSFDPRIWAPFGQRLLLFVLRLSSAWHRVDSQGLLQDGRKGGEKGPKVDCRWKVWGSSEINETACIFYAVSSQQEATDGLFSELLCESWAAFLQNGLVWLNKCGFCTYANKNKYEQELFIVITIQNDTPASGWKFLQLQGSLYCEQNTHFSHRTGPAEWIDTIWWNTTSSTNDHPSESMGREEKTLMWRQCSGKSMLLALNRPGIVCPGFATYYLGHFVQIT